MHIYSNDSALVYVNILCGIKQFVTVNIIARSFSFSTTRLTLHTLLNVSLYFATTLIVYTMMELTKLHRTCLQHYELYRAIPFLFMANEFLLFVTGLLVVAVAVTYASTNKSKVMASGEAKGNRMMSL